jgi:hypothetical protein
MLGAHEGIPRYGAMQFGAPATAHRLCPAIAAAASGERRGAAEGSALCAHPCGSVHDVRQGAALCGEGAAVQSSSVEASKDTAASLACGGGCEGATVAEGAAQGLRGDRRSESPAEGEGCSRSEDCATARGQGPAEFGAAFSLDGSAAQSAFSFDPFRFELEQQKRRSRRWAAATSRPTDQGPTTGLGEPLVQRAAAVTAAPDAPAASGSAAAAVQIATATATTPAAIATVLGGMAIKARSPLPPSTPPPQAVWHKE